MPAAQPVTLQARVSPREWRIVTLISAATLTVAFMPYALAYAATDLVFIGALINPVDGATYLAKMRQGWDGAWLFTLAYTAEPGPGAVLYTYYLALGHLARLSGLSIEAVYQLARVAGGFFLLLAAYAFVSRFFSGQQARLAAWLLFALGSGLGWLALPLGAFTSDLRVAEAIPFLTLLANAHFSLATALLLCILGWTLPALAGGAALWPRLAVIALGVTLLAQVQPLALINLGLIVPPMLLWQAIEQRGLGSRDWLPAAVLAAFGLPWVAYVGVTLSLTHPILAAWTSQNQTPSSPLWDVALSGGLPLLLALPGLALAARRRSPADQLLLAWLVLGVAAMYAPFSLQRRLSFGLWMPLAILAVTGLRQAIWPKLAPRRRLLAGAVIGLLILPSNLLILAVGTAAVIQRHEALFITHDESAALDWLGRNGSAAGGAIVLASPEVSLVVPARASARVVYGHPFETVDADATRAAVLDFYAGRLDPRTFVRDRGVDFVLFGPRERALGGDPAALAWQLKFESGNVAVYAP